MLTGRASVDILLRNMNETRHTLIQRLKSQNDDQAWQTFEETYRRYIYTVLRKMGVAHDEAVDLQQEILVKLWKKLPTFEYQPDKARFRTWLCRVVRNTGLNHMRKSQNENEGKESFQNKDGGSGPEDASEQVLEKMMDQEWQMYITNHAMERIRSKFSEQSVQVFERSLKGADVEDLAQEFGLKENSVYRIKNRVKERLILEIAELRRELE